MKDHIASRADMMTQLTGALEGRSRFGFPDPQRDSWRPNETAMLRKFLVDVQEEVRKHHSRKCCYVVLDVADDVRVDTLTFAGLAPFLRLQGPVLVLTDSHGSWAQTAYACGADKYDVTVQHWGEYRPPSRGLVGAHRPDWFVLDCNWSEERRGAIPEYSKVVGFALHEARTANRSILNLRKHSRSLIQDYDPTRPHLWKPGQ